MALTSLVKSLRGGGGAVPLHRKSTNTLCNIKKKNDYEQTYEHREEP